MSRKHRAPFVALVHLLAQHHPELPDAAHAVAQGRVLVEPLAEAVARLARKGVKLAAIRRPVTD